MEKKGILNSLLLLPFFLSDTDLYHEKCGFKAGHLCRCIAKREYLYYEAKS
jgi:hypothetical protein